MKNSKMHRENLEWLQSQPIEIQYQLFQNFVDVAKLHYSNPPTNDPNSILTFLNF